MACCHYVPVEGGESAFSVDRNAITFGRGVLEEVGAWARALGLSRVAVMTDPRVGALEPFGRALSSLHAAGVDAALYDEVRVEPTDGSFRAAAQFAVEANADGFVSIGGGSVIDTTKAANLYATHPADVLTYVNAPVGEGRPVPGPLRPGTEQAGLGFASAEPGREPLERPRLPRGTPLVRPAPRPCRAGSVGPRGPGEDDVGGDTRRHRVRQRRRPHPPRHVLRRRRACGVVLSRRLPDEKPLVPHGMSVVVNAPAVFRQIAATSPERHLEAAELLGADIGEALPGEALGSRIAEMMKATGMPNGISGVGYDRSHVAALAEGAIVQRRLLDNAPLPVDRELLAGLFEDALTCW
jgi:hypothetical protein